MAETPNSKDVIYVDIEDEITGIIEKVRGAKHQIVALVLPKRSTVLQSVVNMKLLKRTADSHKKHMVLITSDEGLFPLAGSVGIYVAKSLQSKPEIPIAPIAFDKKADDAEEAISMEDEPDEDKPLDKSRPVGELAAPGALVTAADEDMAIELDNTDEDKPDSKSAKASAKKAKKGKNKSLKVPNFDKFRTWLILGGTALIVFIALLYICLTVLPKATVAIKTNSQNVNASLQLTLNTNASTVDPSAEVAPAQIAQAQKTYTGEATTTGQQNNGQTATGSITMTATECAPNLGQPLDVPSGTGISSGGLTFITQQDTTFSSFGKGKGSCQSYEAVGSTNITAQSAGSKYNLTSVKFTISGRSDVSATGTTTGGSDDIIQTVAQADIDSATGKINTDNNAVKSQLESDLQSEGLYPLPATFTAGTPNTSDSNNVGTPASSVTVTESITYTMFGARQSDLQQIIANTVDGQINTSSQKILNYGLDNATITLQSQTASSAIINMQVTAVAGSSLDTSAIKKQVAGEKTGEAESSIQAYPGVTNVSIHLSPFWVSAIPKNTSKIKVTVDNP